MARSILSSASKLVSLVAAGALTAASAMAADWFPYKAESTTPAFAADGKKAEFSYTPLAKASKKWDICVSFPHMKDAYWLGVDYGVIEEARRQGVKLQVSRPVATPTLRSRSRKSRTASHVAPTP